MIVFSCQYPTFTHVTDNVSVIFSNYFLIVHPSKASSAMSFLQTTQFLGCSNDVIGAIVV